MIIRRWRGINYSRWVNIDHVYFDFFTTWYTSNIKLYLFIWVFSGGFHFSSSIFEPSSESIQHPHSQTELSIICGSVFQSHMASPILSDKMEPLYRIYLRFLGDSRSIPLDSFLFSQLFELSYDSPLTFYSFRGVKWLCMGELIIYSLLCG